MRFVGADSLTAQMILLDEIGYLAVCTYSVNVGHDGHTDPIVTGPPIYKLLENGMLTLFIVDIRNHSHVHETP